mmetsp:Transcript_22619/g.57416  ORF Transcript_22619/g.57416 Transcript_22619/m.57416 type:complete len:223 (+) Transcript_22619:531-1199(+)
MAGRQVGMRRAGWSARSREASHHRRLQTTHARISSGSRSSSRSSRLAAGGSPNCTAGTQTAGPRSNQRLPTGASMVRPRGGRKIAGMSLHTEHPHCSSSIRTGPSRARLTLVKATPPNPPMGPRASPCQIRYRSREPMALRMGPMAHRRNCSASRSTCCTCSTNNTPSERSVLAANLSAHSRVLAWWGQPHLGRVRQCSCGARAIWQRTQQLRWHCDRFPGR